MNSKIIRSVFLILALSLVIPQASQAETMSFKMGKSNDKTMTKKQSRKHYRQVRKRYLKAIRKRWRTPCKTYDKIELYRSWQSQLLLSLPEGKLPRHIRRLRKRIYAYRKYAKRKQRFCLKRCKKQWRKELQRSKSKLKPKCMEKFGKATSKKTWLYIGVRPWAYVYIDGMLCGMAPLKTQIKSGKYKIRLTYPPGQDSFQTEFEVKKRQGNLLFRTMLHLPKHKRRKHKGTLSKKQLVWTLQKYRPGLLTCKIFQMKATAVTLSWKIALDGKTHAVKMDAPTPSTKRFRSCILRAVKRWRFPKIKNPVSIQQHTIKL